MRKKSALVRGVGVNDADFPVAINAVIDGIPKQVWICQFYLAWKDMLRRCYSARYHSIYPTYIGCTVAPEWHSFMAFREWMLTQDCEGKQLDKDILYQGNKVYSPHSCVFVSAQLNNFMLDRAAARGEWLIGVYWEKTNEKFRARCRNPITGYQESLGCFDDQHEAHEAWRAKKHEHACRYADMQTDPRIAAALRTRYVKPETEGEINEQE